MADKAWDKYDRDLAAFHDQIYRIDQAAGRYGLVRRPRPPTPPPYPRGQPASQQHERIEPGLVARRSRGRPPWTPELFWTRYRDAVARTKPPPIPDRIAEQFERLDHDKGVDPDYLGRLLRKFGPPPE